MRVGLQSFRQNLDLSLLRKRASQDAAVLFSSQFITAGTSFIVSVLVARNLGPADFAVITTYGAILTTLVGFTDFGLGTGLIKFATPSLGQRSAAAYFRFVFVAEAVIAAVLIAGGLLFSGLIASFLGHEISTNIVRLAVISAALTSATAYVGATLSTYKKFRLSAALSIFVSVMRLILVTLLIVNHNISIINILYGYLIITIIWSCASFFVSPKDYAKSIPWAEVTAAGKQIAIFSGWLTLTFFINSLAGRLDLFYLLKLRGIQQAGIYSAAIQLSVAYAIMVGAASTVLTSHVSEQTTHAKKLEFLKKTIPLAVLGAAFVAITGLFAPLIIEIVFGHKYHAAGLPLAIFAVHFAMNVLLIPISLMLIPLGQIRFGTFIGLIQLGVAVVLYPLLIPHWGAVGAATTVLLTSTIGLIAYPLILRSLLRREKRLEVAVE